MKVFKRMTLLWIAPFVIAMAFLIIPDGSEGLNKHPANLVSREFGNYWYTGKAEITSYKLEQARYGELYSGYAVLVFVTEDFSKRKHVKLDNPGNAIGDAVKVLKLNKIKKFDTGIYSYSMMDSVFTPVNIDEYPNTIKVSSSSQEWCGSTYKQLNLTDKGYKVSCFSYFEAEGNREFELGKEILEDEIWTRIRLAPQSLPVGKVKMIPGTMLSRLAHSELKVETAEAALKVNKDSQSLTDYEIRYPELERSLVITFKKSFPHEIESWEETYPSGFGDNMSMLTTRAVKNKSVITDYWNKNQPEDVVYREELGL
ncbi:MAG: hypothetical protein L0213_07800 [Candidatus Dadabacteria bacterium]|nr:hypothetical protein [Candidatus Dadabacteria bacterium]